jgi:Protein of unknown function, DUF547
MANYYLILSERILNKAKLGEDTSSLRRELFNIRIENLESRLPTDSLKNIFWGNIYNAYFLILKSEQVEDNKIFKIKRLKFSHFVLSLNDIEFGILGTKKINLRFYQFSNPFYPCYIRELAVKKFDPKNAPHLIKSITTTNY